MEELFVSVDNFVLADSAFSLGTGVVVSEFLCVFTCIFCEWKNT